MKNYLILLIAFVSVHFGTLTLSAQGAAPVPSQDASSVLSIFSTTYGNLEGTNYNPNWGQATVVDSSSVLTYTNLNYQGTEFSSQNVSGYEYLHVDFYSDDSTDLGVFVISPGNESEYLLIPSGTLGQWNSVDIPLSHYTTTDLTDVFQLKFDGDGTIVLDNIYFHGTNPDGPAVGLNHIFDGGFGNAVRSTETENLYTFPTGAEGWAGWKFNGDDVWPLTFGSGGSVTITASVPDGGSANVSLHLERENYPNHNPEYEINNIQVSELYQQITP